MTQVERWQKILESQNYAPNTVQFYGDCVRNALKAMNAENPEDVTSDMVEDWMTSHADWSPSSKKVNYAAVRSFFGYLLDKHAIEKDPTGILSSVRIKRHVDESQENGKEDKVYSTEDLMKMVQFVPDQRAFMLRDQAIITLMAGTGMRASEVAWLTVGQFLHREGNTIFARRKGQSVKKVTVADFAIPYITSYLLSRKNAGEQLTDESPLFLTRCGKSVDRHTIYEMLRKRQQALNLRTGTHNMRYTFINAVERSEGRGTSMALAGHKSATTTDIYVVATTEERTKAVNSLPWSNSFNSFGI